MVWFTSVTASDQRDRSYTLSQADAVRAVRSGRYVSYGKRGRKIHTQSASINANYEILQKMHLHYA
jgi:hypothetical protein